MTEEGKKYCKHCGELIDADCVVCPKCGKQVEAFNGDLARQNYAAGADAGMNEQKKKTALILAGVATLLIVAAFIFQNEASIFFVLFAFPLAICSYVFAGFVTMLKWAKNIAFWGWLIIPFPWDLLTGLCTFIFAIMLFLCIPILPVWRACSKVD